MWTTSLAGTHRWTRLTCRRHSWPRALEDGLTALRHDITRCNTGCRPNRRRVHRPRSGLRHDQTPRWRRGMRRRSRTSRRRSGYSTLLALTRGAEAGRLGNRCRGRRRGHWFCRFDLHRGFRCFRDVRARLLQHCRLGFESSLLRESRLSLRRSGRRGRLGRHDHRRWRTWNRLRRDKSRRRLGFNRSRRLRTGSRRSRL